MKKLIIVGGGIAGLSAGVYARQSGFDTTIYESHSIPGGFCTSWKRGGYLFEGGMHWLTGSAKDQPLNKLWREVGAIDDNTPIYRRDPFTTYDYQGQTVCLYRDLDKLRAHFLEVSPEDKPAIDKLYKDISAFKKMKMPITDIKGVKVKQKSVMSAGDMMGMMPILAKMGKLSKLTSTEYIESLSFKSPALCAVLKGVVGPDFNSVALLATLSTFAAGDGGYPKGGSLAMALNMAKRFQSLGGKIVYNTKVEQVILEAGHAKGVIINNEKILSDAVIVTQDTLAAIDHLFEKPLQEAWMADMRKKTRPTLNTFVSIGVEADLSDLPGSIVSTFETPQQIGGLTLDGLGVYNYAGYEGYAPQGCTALTVPIMGDSYDFWKKCKEEGTYEPEKQKVGDAVVVWLAEVWPQTAGKIAVVDVATPLTYERYCGSYKGSWMSHMNKGEINTTYPIANDTLKHLYFAGQRMMPPGGVPAAVSTGRSAVQYLCRDTDTVFQGQS